jgi:copper chaperone
MSCGHCKAAIEKEVGKIEGVKSVVAEPTTKEVVVREL